MNDCSICCETFNKSDRSKINCKTCKNDEILVCRSCAKRYILEQPTDPSCMVCKVQWDQEFLSDNFTKTFVTKELKQHRENYLFEKQMALLPETQEYAEQLKLVKTLEKKKEEVYKKRSELETKLRKMNNEIREIDRTIFDIQHGNQSYQQTEKSKFTYKCPVENCNGFLNEKYECGICDNNICKHCMEIKEEEHVCNEEKKQTVALLKQDTKPCPKCGELIHKLKNGCFAKNTPILMWNGTVKLSQDIEIGDKLIGDDGNVRTVTKLMNGFDDMYKIQQNNAEDFVVNSKHILTVYFHGNGKITNKETSKDTSYELMWFDKQDYSVKTKRFKTKDEAEQFKSFKQINENLLDIPLENYLKMPDSKKKQIKGIKLQNSINWDYKNIELDPYVLGLWLGDGYSNGKEFCTNDKEILEYWSSWCEVNNAIIIKRNDKFRYYIKNKDNETENVKANPNRNPLKEKLEKYNLINNKYIPNDYLINSKDVRLKVLAGIIDTDGCVQNDGRRIIIITIYDKLSQNIEFLANSLGYSVHVTIRKRNNVKCPNAEPKDYKDQYHINISGENIDEIPTILAHKQCKKQKGGVNLRTTAIEIIKMDQQEYYGWAVTDNKRFLLKDFTIVHNCDQMYCIKCHTAFSWNKGTIDRGTIHNPEYYRWMRENGQQIPRNPLDIVHDLCGNDVIDYTRLLRIIRIYFPEKHASKQSIQLTNSYRDQIQTVTISNMHRMLQHINFAIRGFTNENEDNERTLRTMRANYILGYIKKDEFKTKVQSLEKKRNKNSKINDIWNLLRLVLLEYIGKISEQRYTKEEGVNEINKIIKESKNIRKYCNNSFQKIGKMFNMVYPGITQDWIHVNNWETYLKQQQRQKTGNNNSEASSSTDI